jgi:hypothetical protein
VTPARVVLAFPMTQDDAAVRHALAGGRGLAAERSWWMRRSARHGDVRDPAVLALANQGTYFLGFNATSNWNDHREGRHAGSSVGGGQPQ